MPTSTNVTNLKINELTEAQYDAAVQGGVIGANELSVLTDAQIDPLPSQTGNAGKFLTTDGTDASWSDKPLVNTATGANSLSVLGIATTQQYNLFVGKSSGGNNSQYSTYIGHLSSSVGGSSFYNTCIGYSACTNSGVGGCVQLGWGTNTESGSFCVGLSNNVGGNHNNYKLLSLDGTIPEARLADMTSATAGQVLTLDSNNNAVWKAVTVTTTATLVAADWSSNAQTITVQGVTTTNVVFVSPDPASLSDYASAGITCVSQGTDSLTFNCVNVPSNAITVSIVML